MARSSWTLTGQLQRRAATLKRAGRLVDVEVEDDGIATSSSGPLRRIGADDCLGRPRRIVLADGTDAALQPDQLTYKLFEPIESARR